MAGSDAKPSVERPHIATAWLDAASCTTPGAAGRAEKEREQRRRRREEGRGVLHAARRTGRRQQAGGGGKRRPAAVRPGPAARANLKQRRNRDDVGVLVGAHLVAANAAGQTRGAPGQDDGAKLAAAAESGASACLLAGGVCTPETLKPCSTRPPS